MFKLIVLFAILAAAFAAPKPDPSVSLYTSGIPLAYSGIGSPIGSSIGYSPIAYNNLPYASGYYNNYYGSSPYAFRNVYL